MKFFQEDLKRQNSPSMEELRTSELSGGTISFLLLLHFLPVSFGTRFRKDAGGPFFKIRKKPCQCIVALD